MSDVENGTTISNLVSTNPGTGDPVNQGDDHLRLIKRVLQSQFPDSGGNGFIKPLTASSTELNWVKGVTSGVQQQIDDIKSEGSTLDGRITSNEQNIQTNTAQLAINTSAIVSNTEEISLQGGRIYDLEQAIGINVAGVFDGVSGVSQGTGFTIHKFSTGFYEVTMAPAPIGAYSVVCSSNGITAVDITSLSTFNIVVTDDQLNPVDLSDISFQVVFL